MYITCLTKFCACMKDIFFLQAWDDVVRKVKPVEKPFEYKRSLNMDQEKSKLSLAEIYEKEYIKQTEVYFL